MARLQPQESEPMTASPNRILDDIARLVTDAAGAAQGVRREVETMFKSQFERLLRDMDLVTRDEFEAVRDMAILAREENERLGQRILALEAAGNPFKAPAKAAPVKPRATKG
jgi:BMFP domain-containing protein YqiC